MKYLVTGGAGFIGSHLVELLLEQNHHVFAIDDLSTGKLSNLKEISKNRNLLFLKADVTDVKILKKINYKADGVFHLAASVGVRKILNHPWKTIVNNIDGTKSVIDYCIKNKSKLLFTSTSEVYGKSKKDFFSENDDHIIGPVDKTRWCYAVSKLLDEHMILAATKKFNFPAVIVRLFNTIGDRQTGQYGMVVPTFINQALNNKPLTVHGSGNQSRCFCYVDDVTSAMLKLMQTDSANGKVLNLGSNELVTINYLAKLVIKHTHSRSKIVHIPYHKAYPEGFEETQRRKPDLRQIQKLIGFKPRYTLKKSIELMIKYNYSSKH